MICTYCGLDKPESEFSAEHVIPRALIGGGLEPTNPFILRTVCRTCNTRCGQHVDRPFIKNWLLHNDRAQNARRYLDFSRSPEIPLAFLGCLRESPFPGKVCDYWAGPTGDAIFHFHDSYPDPTAVGKPLKTPGQAYDDGLVFLFVHATNPVWHPCILESTADVFDGSRLYLVNGQNPSAPFQPVPAEHAELKDKLVEILKRPLGLQSQMQIDFGNRFIAKLALGFGGLLLPPAFATSAHAKRLRSLLWEQDFEKHAEKQVRGTGFMGTAKDSAQDRYLAWEPGHVVYIADLGDMLALVSTFYGNQTALIEIARDRALWADSVPREGIVYVIAPGFKSSQRSTLGRYIAARNGQLPGTDELVRFIRAVENAPELPPPHLPGTGPTWRQLTGS